MPPVNKAVLAKRAKVDDAVDLYNKNVEPFGLMLRKDAKGRPGRSNITVNGQRVITNKTNAEILPILDAMNRAHKPLQASIDGATQRIDDLTTKFRQSLHDQEDLKDEISGYKVSVAKAQSEASGLRRANKFLFVGLVLSVVAIISMVVN